MPNVIKNGKVVYVEPNIAADFTSYNSSNKGTVYKSVNLEDMCIVVGLEVEVKGRTYRSSDNGNQNNINLEWQSSTSGERISFMEGTKIPTAGGGFVRSLTTNYTDCHLFDVENGGTAEMFGIKSIDISYDNFMVPEVTIQFIDVRGVSLFAQEEMRHHLTGSNGMTGIADNSIEGSFFKCFFTFPYPKFTLKVKGFYGEMVSYELTCSDFRAAFDSNTGNFNVTAKFIGYAFSFLGDVMVNGLVSAPYSEYLGKKYWEDNLANNRFTLENGIGAIEDSEGNSITMPKLGQICKMYKEIQQSVAEQIKENGMEKIIEENGGTKEEIETAKSGNSSLLELRATYKSLIDKLKNIASKINGDTSRKNAGDIAINPKGTNSYAIIINSSYEGLDELVEEFSQFKDKFSKLATDSEELDKWSKSADNLIAFKKLGAYGDIINRSKHVTISVQEDVLRIAIDKKSNEKLPTIGDEKTYYQAWVDWIDSKVYVYQDFKLGEILSEKVNEGSSKEKDSAKVNEKYEQILINKEFSKVFKFEPTVENITKIIMAHVETFIYMISQCSDNIISSGTKRSAENLEINYKDFPDIAKNDAIGATKDTIVAPFPKVVNTSEENGVSKTEGYWIGNILDQDQAEEIKLVEGILNGVAEAADDINAAFGESASDTGEDVSGSNVIKYPLTYFDLFLKDGDNPFGDILLSDVNNVFASMCVRAFSIMATQGDTDVDAYTYGMLDAENFLEFYKNDGNIKFLGSMIKSINTEKVINFLSSNDNRLDPTKRNNPWYRYGQLLTSKDGKIKLKAGYLGGNSAIFPIKNWNFLQISQYAVQNDENPASGLKNKAIDNYIITPLDDENSASPIIIAKDAPILYFKNTYTKHETEDDTTSKIFKNANKFEFDYEEWVEKYSNWKSFFDNSGERVNYKECITYDNNGNVSSTNECALDFKNLFMNESFLKKDEYSRGVEFIEKVFQFASYENSFKITSGSCPNFGYVGKFSILRDGAYLADEKNRTVSNNRQNIFLFYKNYLDNWVKNEYPKIEADYMLQFRPGKNLSDIEEAKKNLGLKDINGFELALKKILSEDYWTKFQKVYSVSNSSNGNVYLKTRPCEEMDKIIKDLMKIVGLCSTSKFNTATESNIALNKSQLDGYFNGFISILNDKLDGYGDVNTAETKVEINNDPEDIKVGVYNYIKMLYDKWIASNSQDDFYKIEALFDGHNPTFHFVDSAYNRVGKSMYLNLSTLVDRIAQSQQQNGYTLLSMLSGLYADNKFLFLCIQNFLDLGRDDMMEKMFKPIPYLDIIEPNNHPNFVVLMPYEPSSRLDVEGADYPDDGFYLNDERTWPEMIRSKSDDSHPIPAFGVCYGQQYQNYFKNIQVDMNAPMVTEQSIKAKFMIAGAYSSNNDNGPKIVTSGQDLYTIYSNNSYTCTVTMMGCAWVQPMMYFVLQNVPMFRGSYMIVKVNHQIQAGNMITTFKGVRMANTATRSVKQYIYGSTNDSVGIAGGDGIGLGSSISPANYANIANDCNYAYYSPINSVITPPSDADAKTYCYATYLSLINAGLTEKQAKGICANIKEESGFNPYVITIDGDSKANTHPDDRRHHGVGGGLCGFYYHGMGPDLFNFVYGTAAGRHKLDELNDKVEPFWRQNPIAYSPKNTKRMAEANPPLIYDIPFEKQVEYICHLTNTPSYSGIRNQGSETDSAWWWMVEYERPAEKYRTDRWGKNGKWVESAIQSKMATISAMDSAAKGKSIDEIANGLREAFEKSLKASQYYNQTSVTIEKKQNDFYEYKASGTNATNALFDCILSSYGQWFDQIRWYVATTQAKNDAIGVRVHIVKTAPASHNIIISCENDGKEAVLTLTKKEDVNESLRLILIKYFKSKNISQPQQAKSIFKSCTRMTDDVVKEIFELSGAASIRDCNSVMGESAGSPNIKGTNAKISEYFPNGVNSEEEAKNEMVTFRLATGQNITMHKKVKDKVISAFNEIKNTTTYNVTAVNGFSWRKVKNGNNSGKLSNHSYGLAIDINAGSAGNPFFDTHNLPLDNTGIPTNKSWPWKYRMSGGSPIAGYYNEYSPDKCIWYHNHPVVKIMAKYGFGWGGRYGDTMHFSVFNGA